MLKQRIITAAILIPLVVWAIFALPKPWFTLLVGVIFIGASWEWSNLSSISQKAYRAGYSLLIGCLMLLVWQLVIKQPELIKTLMYAALVFWCAVLVWLYRFETGTGNNPVGRLQRLLIGLVVLLMPYTGLVVLVYHTEEARALIMYLLVTIWAADGGAYFAGRTWGKHKLAPSISPGKSREGVVGGLVTVLLVAVIAAFLFGYSGKTFAAFLIITMVSAIFSVAGDLFESIFKRQTGIKDSGNLLPGHGGLLDRLDSMTSAVPVFISGLYMFGMVG